LSIDVRAAAHSKASENSQEKFARKPPIGREAF